MLWKCSIEDFWESLELSKEVQSIDPKGNQSWIFIGRIDAEAETPIFWPPAVKNWLIWKDPDAGKDWRQEEKGTTEDEMVGWHHRLKGHEFEETLGVGDGQGGLACCSPLGSKESDTTEQLNWLKVSLLTLPYLNGKEWKVGWGQQCAYLKPYKEVGVPKQDTGFYGFENYIIQSVFHKNTFLISRRIC